jgi:hypothetical protein
VEALAELPLCVPIVNPRLGADAAADWPLAPPRLPKGFSFCHQLTFCGGWDIGGVIVDEVLAGGLSSIMLGGSPPTCSRGVQIRRDSRV